MGLAGAVTAAGTFALSGGADIRAEVGRFLLVLGSGFLVGFVSVYVAPANEVRR